MPSAAPRGASALKAGISPGEPRHCSLRHSCWGRIHCGDQKAPARSTGTASKEEESTGRRKQAETLPQHPAACLPYGCSAFPEPVSRHCAQLPANALSEGNTGPFSIRIIIVELPLCSSHPRSPQILQETNLQRTDKRGEPNINAEKPLQRGDEVPVGAENKSEFMESSPREGSKQPEKSQEFRQLQEEAN